MSEYSVEIKGRGEDVLYSEADRRVWASIAIHGTVTDLDAYALTAFAEHALQ
jgi:hypothetical protein